MQEMKCMFKAKFRVTAIMNVHSLCPAVAYCPCGVAVRGLFFPVGFRNVYLLFNVFRKVYFYIMFFVMFNYQHYFLGKCFFSIFLKLSFS